MRATAPGRDPSTGPGRVAADRRAQTADALLPGLVAGCVVLLAAAGLRLLLDPGPGALPATLTIAAVGVLMGLLRLWLLRPGARAWFRRHPDGTALAACLVAGAGAFSEVLLTGRPVAVGGPMMFLLAASAVLNDRRHSALVTAACLVTWLAVATGHGLEQEWGPLTVLVVCAAVLARVLNRVRCRAADYLAAAEVSILEAAVTDELTGLSNRRGLLAGGRALARGATEQAPLACLYLDVDGLKATNDRLGHAAGDDLVRATARALCAAARPEDVVARLGGDEFALLLPGTAAAEADRVRDRLGARLRQAGVSASVGLAVSDGTTDVEDLLGAADAAMYTVKQVRRATATAGVGAAVPVLPAQRQAPPRPRPGSAPPLWADPAAAVTADLRELSLAGAWLHLALVPVHLLVLPDVRGPVMAVVSLLVAAGLFPVRRLVVAAGPRGWSRGRSDLVLFGALAVLSTETVVYGFLVAEPWAAITVVLPVVAAGGLLVSRRRVSLVCLVSVVGWSALAVVQGPATVWVWSGASVLSAVGVAALLHVSHRRTIGRLTAAQAQVRVAALTDELTGLPNRRGFLARGRPMVELSLRRGEQASVLFLDLDGLKQINDQQGHAAGDRLLRTAALVLRRSGGPRDLCARLGGDEFTVLLHGCPAEEVPARVAWLCDALAAEQVSASIGVAHLPRDARSLDGLVDHADRQMLAVKQARRPAGR